MLTLLIRTFPRTPHSKALVQWAHDIIDGSRDGLAMQDRYEALSRLADWELAQYGVTRADIPRLVINGSANATEHPAHAVFSGLFFDRSDRPKP